MEFHPIADLFPLMANGEFDELVADIKANGLQERIATYKGKILDGRNRFTACNKAGVAPAFIEFNGDDPVAFVISRNLRRRHLDESQRAMVAASLARLKPSQTKQAASKEAAQGKPDVSQDEAAKLLNVSRASVQRAAAVQEHAIPEIVEQVNKGTVPVTTAAEVARMPSPKQKAVAEFFAEGKPAEAKKIITKHTAKKKAKRHPNAPDKKKANAALGVLIRYLEANDRYEKHKKAIEAIQKDVA